MRDDLGQDTLLRDLFGPPPVPDVPGLAYLADYVDAASETALLAAIDSAPWSTTLKRRTQQYGFAYDAASGRRQPPVRLGALPAWLDDLARRLHDEGLMSPRPDTSTVNEYERGQGIAPHVDLPAFGPTVAILSLGSACVMDLYPPEGADDASKRELLLERRSLAIFSGDARSRWMHGIAHRQNDRFQGISFPRARRVSVTLRTLM